MTTRLPAGNGCGIVSLHFPQANRLVLTSTIACAIEKCSLTCACSEPSKRLYSMRCMCKQGWYLPIREILTVKNHKAAQANWQAEPCKATLMYLQSSHEKSCFAMAKAETTHTCASSPSTAPCVTWAAGSTALPSCS